MSTRDREGMQEAHTRPLSPHEQYGLVYQSRITSWLSYGWWLTFKMPEPSRSIIRLLIAGVVLLAGGFTLGMLGFIAAWAYIELGHWIVALIVGVILGVLGYRTYLDVLAAAKNNHR